MRGLRARSPLALASPFLVGLAVLVLVPMVATGVLAFTRFTGTQPPVANGVDNFARMATDAPLRQSLANTGVHILLAVPLRLAAAFVLAVVLHRRGRGYNAGRAVAFLPSVVPDVALALLWLWLLNPYYGPVAHVLYGLGLPAPSWLTDPWSARVAVAVMGGLQVGEAFLVALAWRRSIPDSLYEMAAVDGARPAFVLRRVTLPLMAPVLGLLALRDVVLSLQASFGPSLLVTGGGPRKATTYLPMYVYDQAFRYFRLGYAAAIATALLVATGAVVAAQYLVARRWRLL
ncbi:MAG TPA: sugar ABC transporter permease [Acidimicrobiales bacterium]|nr:sugar ABC transporter permease [Acidimicrobiales bacterium]